MHCLRRRAFSTCKEEMNERAIHYLSHKSKIRSFDLKKSWISSLMFSFWISVLAYPAPADFDHNTLTELRKTSTVVASALTLKSELLCIRQALGEMTEAESKNDLKNTIARWREELPNEDEIQELRKECSDAAEKLIEKAESQLDSAHWPGDRPTPEYHSLAQLTLEETRLQLIYLAASDGDVAEPARTAAEVLGWTEGRSGAGQIFDSLDSDIEASMKDFFSRPQPPRPAPSLPGKSSISGPSINESDMGTVQNVQSAGSVPLMLFWNPKRGDNFTTGTGQGKSDASATGYQLVRIEGFAPTEGTPLKLYWNEKNGDNFVTATAEGERDALGSGYVFVRVEAHVFDKPSAGTVPLKLFWNEERGDNFTTATPEGEHDALSSGYRFVRIEGYVKPVYVGVEGGGSTS